MERTYLTLGVSLTLEVSLCRAKINFFELVLVNQNDD